MAVFDSPIPEAVMFMLEDMLPYQRLWCPTGVSDAPMEGFDVPIGGVNIFVKGSDAPTGGCDALMM